MLSNIMKQSYSENIVPKQQITVSNLTGKVFTRLSVLQRWLRTQSTCPISWISINGYSEPTLLGD